MTVRVTAPAVQVAVGSRVHHLTRGAALPSGVDPETVERLTAKGLVCEVDDATGEAEPTPQERYEALTVAELTTLIGERNADRADDAKVSADGKKADLVAALLADDVASAGQQ